MFIGCRLFFVLAEGHAGDLDLRVGQPSAVAFLEGPAGELDFWGAATKVCWPTEFGRWIVLFVHLRGDLACGVLID